MNDRALYDAMTQRMAGIGDDALRVSAPLYYEPRDGRLGFLGSAVFLAVRDHRFLITAGHALDEAAGRPVYAGGERQLVQVGRIGADWRHSVPPDGERLKDAADLAVLRLTPAEVDALDVGYLQPDQLDPAYQPDPRPIVGTYYLCVGFPASRQSTWRMDGQLLPRQLYLALKMGPEPPEIDAKYTDRWNLTADFEKEDGVGPNGEVVVFPDPVGMSGGGIWAVNGLVAAKPAAPRLVAISTTWHKGANAIIGTRVGLVFDAVATLEPALRAVLPWPDA